MFYWLDYSEQERRNILDAGDLFRGQDLKPLTKRIAGIKP
jgi:hypothetical protein